MVSDIDDEFMVKFIEVKERRVIVEERKVNVLERKGVIFEKKIGL